MFPLPFVAVFRWRRTGFDLHKTILGFLEKILGFLEIKPEYFSTKPQYFLTKSQYFPAKSQSRYFQLATPDIFRGSAMPKVGPVFPWKGFL